MGEVGGKMSLRMDISRLETELRRLPGVMNQKHQDFYDRLVATLKSISQEIEDIKAKIERIERPRG